MNVVDPKIQRIIDWRESFVTLPDNHFFELIRMYLGEIHSPFNKQKLVEQLSSFLRKEENRTTIVRLLSMEDRVILSAIRFIPFATKEKIASFFEGTFNFAELYEKLLNLEERLLIYRHIDKKNGKILIDINPTLEDIIFPLTELDVLLPESSKDAKQKNNVEAFFISPEKIAAFISFINENPALCKADGSLKKRSADRIEEIFGKKSAIFFQFLMRAFENLSLVKSNSDEKYEIDHNRFKKFAELDEKIQYLYLCIASHTRTSRNYLVKHAKNLLATLNFVPENGFSKNIFIRAAYLLSENSEEENSLPSGRFSAMLMAASRSQKGEQQFLGENQNSALLIDSIFDSLVSFGLLEKSGKDLDGNAIYKKGHILSEKSFDSNAMVLSIDAGFNVLLFPGLSLLNLIPLMDFMNIVKFDTAATFELSRKSVTRGFDLLHSPQDIIQLLQKYSLYQIPENLRASIEDWRNSYSVAELYKGYVLKVDEKKAVLIQKNPSFAQKIWKVLAPGVFLINAQDDSEAEKLLNDFGLDYAGKIKTRPIDTDSKIFPSFSVQQNLRTKLNLATKSASVNGDDKKILNQAELQKSQKEHFESMREFLSSLTLTSEQKEGLLLRINKKIVLCKEQLKPTSVRLECIEASGMDYQGKIHVAESAITQNMMLSLEYDDKNAPGGIATFIGTPLSVEKNSIDSFVHIVVEPDKMERTFSIGAAKNVRRVRGSLLQ